MRFDIPVDARSFDLPKSLAELAPLALNLRWAWHAPTAACFQEIRGEGGPVAKLRRSDQLAELAKDKAYVAQVQAAAEDLRTYLASAGSGEPVAYFCAEYGLHETFSLYSGGLGILAGDHLKEASDQNLPLIGIGLFYRAGFFRQIVDHEGRQEHVPPVLHPDDLPMQRTTVKVHVSLPGRTVVAAVWRADVGRVPLLLLDTDLPENSAEDRKITGQLYTSGRDMRLHQEVVLGIGGAKALAALGIQPRTWHMNEGHSALLLVERLRAMTASGTSLVEAKAQVKASSILTIHTPVPAGNERFGADHVAKVLGPSLEGSELSIPALLAMGLDSVKDKSIFDMTGFAIRLSRAANGVSLLHGKTADKTWRKVAGFEVGAVTNGVHLPTWLGPEMTALLEDAGATFVPGTALKTAKGKERPVWTVAGDLPDEALWQAHLDQKRRLIEFARRRLFEQHARHGEGPDELRAWLESLEPNALILGFARRFATYKRAHLIFRDERRLAKLLNAKDRPVRIVFAGKAHPADRAGQALIAQVYKKAMSPKFRGKVFFLEEYDMEVGRHLVQGVDVWLNNPRRPLEASGTSGMKAAANGVPNASILDGWWDEAYEGGKTPNGFAIGGRKTVADEKAQDAADAEALYKLLEDEIVPTFFDADGRGLPARWLPVMKRSIATSLWAFSSARMIEDYAHLMY
jgi:starch phosphorylase